MPKKKKEKREITPEIKKAREEVRERYDLAITQRDIDQDLGWPGTTQ